MVAVDDQLSLGSALEGLRDRTRGQIRIEGHQCQPRRLEEDHHHDRHGEQRPFAAQTPCSHGPDDEGDSCDHQRQPQIGE